MEKKVPVKGKIWTELNLLSVNNFYNNSSYQLLNVGHMPATLLRTFSGFCQVILKHCKVIVCLCVFYK